MSKDDRARDNSRPEQDGAGDGIRGKGMNPRSFREYGVGVHLAVNPEACMAGREEGGILFQNRQALRGPEAARRESIEIDAAAQSLRVEGHGKLSRGLYCIHKGGDFFPEDVEDCKANLAPFRHLVGDRRRGIQWIREVLKQGKSRNHSVLRIGGRACTIRAASGHRRNLRPGRRSVGLASIRGINAKHGKTMPSIRVPVAFSSQAVSPLLDSPKSSLSPVEALESLVFRIVLQMVGDAEFYKALVSHMKGNAGQEITSESARLNEMKINYAKIRNQAETLARRLMEDAELKGSRILGRNLLELEQNKRALREEIQRAEQSLEDRKKAEFDPDLLKGYLDDFTRVYEKMPLEQKRRLNHALFS